MIGYIQIPGTDIRLFDGTVIAVEGYSDTRWVVHFGWCIYDNTPYNGWYCISIPDGVILALSEELLVTVKVLAPAPKPIPGPIPPPMPHGYKDRLLDPAFITVSTLLDRDRLNLIGNYVPDGKIVRVNNVDDVVKYYVWNATESKWDDYSFASEITPISEAEIDSILAGGSISEDLHFLDAAGLAYFYNAIAQQIAELRMDIQSLYDLINNQ